MKKSLLNLATKNTLKVPSVEALNQMNFIFGVVAPIAYFILRSLVKRLVMNFLQKAKVQT